MSARPDSSFLKLFIDLTLKSPENIKVTISKNSVVIINLTDDSKIIGFADGSDWEINLSKAFKNAYDNYPELFV